ncbi:MAG TPA: EamA family transporter RarD [Paracoccaceae bacterium]|nr:EamA family transporter RarD [Paracoccaceae bacterium]
MTDAAIRTAEHEDSTSGLAFAVSAYFLWGFLPLYMKAVAHISPAEVVAHRIIWSVPFALVVLVLLRRTSDIRAALSSPKLILMAAATAAFISVNWGLYVWSIGSGHAIEAALGYYINPLFSILLGAIVLREKLNRLQWVAIAVAAAGVIVLTVAAGKAPWIALGMTFTWGIYALLKRRLPIGPNQGFLLEVLILLPFALGYLAKLTLSGEGHFGGTTFDTLMLLGLGAVTAGPLMLYANGAKRLRLSTIAILQYIAPTMIFLTAVFIFGEPFGAARAVAFPLIWASVVIYLYSIFRRAR